MAKVTAYVEGELFDPKDVADAMASPEVISVLLEVAAKAADYAKMISPVGDPTTDPNSGTYRDSIVVERDGKNVYVVFSDPKANLVEYGSIHNDAYAVRARTELAFETVQHGAYTFHALTVAPKRISGRYLASLLEHPGQRVHEQPRRGRRRK